MHDGDVGHREGTLGHHLCQRPEAELEAQMLPHAQKNDLAIQVPILEQLLRTAQPGHHVAFEPPDRPEDRGSSNRTYSHQSADDALREPRPVS
jgi:hypothetical protein